MKNTSRTALFLFFTTSIVNLYAVGSGLEVLNSVSKPLLIALLLGWFLLQTRDNPHPSKRFFVAGLLFSSVGDILLMFVKIGGELFFLLGLGSFLFAHLSYISSFTKFPAFNTGAIWVRKWLIIPFLIMLTGVLLMLWDSLGAFLTPVVVYATVIVSMSAFAFNMKNRVLGNIFQMLFTGAVLFVISDLIIAMKKFKYPELSEASSGLAIMATYLLGQFLLTLGMVKACTPEKESITQVVPKL